MSASAVVKYLLSLFKWESQSICGSLRFGLTWFVFYILAKCDTGSGRQAFACGSEANDGLKRRCFSKYSADMSSFLLPSTLVLMTAGALFVLWSLISVYSSKHLQKIRRKTNDDERKQLCHELWKKSLLHVCSELALVITTLIIFFCTQEISLPETYNCTLWNASEEIGLTCEDVHHWDKSKLNFAFILGMAVLAVLCIATIFDLMCNKEHFIKDLLNLNAKDKEADDEDSNHHRSTPRNATDGSDGLTNTSNPNEQPDAPLTHKRRNMDAAQVPDVIFLDLADDISLDWKKLGGRLLISPFVISNIDAENHLVSDKTMAMLNKWKQKFGKKATVQVLRKALGEIKRGDLSGIVEDKMLALSKEQLPSAERGLAPWNTETDLPGYTDSSWQSRLETSPNLTGTTRTQTPPLPESSLISSTIRHR